MNTTTNTPAEILASVTVDQVMAVYSGKVGECYCGCAGNHRYASAHTEAAAVLRGYAIAAGEINDRQIKKVLGIVQANFSYDPSTCRKGNEPFHIQGDDGNNSVTHFTVEVGERSYTVYLLPN